jgi:2'-5' RNA ligase
MDETDPARTRRLFFALWPDATTRECLTQALRGIVPAQARATHSNDLHLTLVFLGSLDASTQHCAEQAAALVRVEPFTLTLDKLGHWPGPRILWLGAAHCPDALLELVTGLHRALQPCKIKPDERPYQPHLTFARKVHAAAALPALSAPIEWRVSSFALAESQPRSDGARYRVLTTRPLAAAG